MRLRKGVRMFAEQLGVLQARGVCVEHDLVFRKLHVRVLHSHNWIFYRLTDAIIKASPRLTSKYVTRSYDLMNLSLSTDVVALGVAPINDKRPSTTGNPRQKRNHRKMFTRLESTMKF